jgi:3-dehydroquinate synthase
MGKNGIQQNQDIRDREKSGGFLSDERTACPANRREKGLITVTVRLRSFFSDRSYPIRIGSGILSSELLRFLAEVKPTKIGVVTDSQLAGRCRELFQPLAAIAPLTVAEFPSGERNKTVGTVMTLFSEFARAKFDRRSILVAFGGGVTGDMTGFLASIYMRGIPFVQIPTSVLSMSDSSIGGKTGVDMPEGKNLVGAFYQPAAVIIDTDMLKTLPGSEFVNGMAEVIKHGLISDSGFFRRISESREDILAGKPESLVSMIETNCRIKGRVVRLDERERGLRQTLNFGHTFGHAVERASDFSIPHGYAIALGMAAEGYISCRRGILQEADLARMNAELAAWGLLSYAGRLASLDRGIFGESAAMDKKNAGGKVKAVLLERIGRVYRKGGLWSFDISREEMAGALDFFAGLH